MTLRTKVLLALIGAIAIIATGVHAVLDRTIRPDFQLLEEEQARRELSRAVDAIQDQLVPLQAACFEWSRRENLMAALRERDIRPLRESLAEEVRSSEVLDFACLIAADAQLLDQLAFAPAGTREPIAIDSFAAETWSPSHPYLISQGTRESVAEVRMTEIGPALVAARPVRLATDGPPLGHVVVGRILTDQVHRKLLQQTLVAFQFWDPTRTDLPERERRALCQLLAGELSVSEPISRNVRRVYGILPDAFGGPALLLRVDVARDVSERGQALFQRASAGALGVIIAALLSLYLLLDRLLLRSRPASPAPGAVALRATPPPADELDDHTMVDAVALSLGEVRTSAQVLSSTIQTGAMAHLPALWKSLGDAFDTPLAADGPEGLHSDRLIDWIRRLQSDWTAMRRESDSLLSGVRRAETLIDASRQPTVPGVPARTILTAILEEAILASGDVTGPHPIEIARELDPLPAVEIDRAALLDATTLLLRNARAAIASSAPDQHAIIISLQRLAEEWVRVEIADSGGRIGEEEWRLLFQPGPDADGSGRGRGLYQAAARVGEMGGSLTARNSDCGVTFTLDLPVGLPVT